MIKNKCGECIGINKCWPSKYVEVKDLCPCKNCLVKGICVTICDEFLNLATIYINVMEEKNKWKKQKM